MSVESPELQFFTPAQPEDIRPPMFTNFNEIIDKKYAGIICDVINATYGLVEADALPPPAEATVQSASGALLQDTPASGMRFDTCLGNRDYSLSTRNEFSVPFIPRSKWEHSPIKDLAPPIVTFVTSLSLKIPEATNEKQNAEILRTLLHFNQAERSGLAAGGRDHTANARQIMGVRGQRRSIFPGSGYMYNEEQRDEVRGKLAEVFKKIGSPVVTSASVHVIPPRKVFYESFFPLAVDTNFDVRPPELTVPALSVLRRLVTMQTIEEVPTLPKRS